MGSSLETPAAKGETEVPAIYAKVIGEKKASLFGDYTPLDKKKTD